MLSNYGEVGQKVRWNSAAGTQTGIIERVDRDKATADPVKNADYYLVRHKDGRGSYLNSNMMKQLAVTNLSIYNQSMEALGYTH